MVSTAHWAKNKGRREETDDLCAVVLFDISQYPDVLDGDEL